MPSKKPVLSERDIQRQITDLLSAHGWQVERNNQFLSGNAVIAQGTTSKGKPDLLVWRGLTWSNVQNVSVCLMAWIEVKKPGEKPTRDQHKCHLEIRAAGGTVLVLHSLEEAAEAFGIKL